MTRPERRERAGALQILLTLVAVAAGGFLFLLVVVAVVGASFTTGKGGGVPPEMAGLAPGETAPAIAAEAWLNGEPASFDGQVVVVQGWFYNCKYCWQEAPELASLHKKYGDRVSFVGLSTDSAEDAELVKDFVAKNELTYPIGYGRDSAMTLVRGFGAQAFPAIWVIGKDGTVVWNLSVEGEQSLEEAIEAALKGPAA